MLSDLSVAGTDLDSGSVQDKTSRLCRRARHTPERYSRKKLVYDTCAPPDTEPDTHALPPFADLTHARVVIPFMVFATSVCHRSLWQA